MTGASPEFVYLTARVDGPASARFYAAQAARKHGGQPVVLRVLVDGSDLDWDPDDRDIQSGRYQYVIDEVPVAAVKEIGGKRVGKLQKSDVLEKARKLHGRMKFQGFDISIENRKGSVRRWYDKATDTEGQTKMLYPYGYIRGTEGADGDHVDVFVGPHADAKHVYVIHQLRAPAFKEFDEDKCMMGFRTAAEAKTAYLKHYDRPDFFGGMDTLPVEEFRKKVYGADGDMIKAERPPSQVEWMWAVQKAGIAFDEFADVVRKARAGDAAERERLDTVYAELEKAGAADSLYVDYGLDLDIVGQMGIQAYPREKKNGPRRSPLRGQPHNDWPVGRIDAKQPGRRPKNPKLLLAKDRLDVRGRRTGDRGWGAQVVDNHEHLIPLRPKRLAVNEQDAKDSLAIQQESRRQLREGMKLHGMEIRR